MLTLPEPVQIYFCTQPTDMRKGFDTLATLVRDHLGYDPLSGHLFVFRSRRGDRGTRPLELSVFDEYGARFLRNYDR